MKKQWIYLGLATLVGIGIGYLLFGERASVSVQDTHADAHKKEDALWTCAMHPQIIRKEPGDCPICGMELIPASENAGEMAMASIHMSEHALALAGVETLFVGNDSPGGATLVLSGTIKENETSGAVQSAYMDGRIESLRITYKGEQVQKGQLLMTLYAPQLVAAQQELLTASGLKASQPELYRAVRKKLELWKLSDAQIDRIERSGKVVDTFPIYAQVSGTVHEVMVKEGDYVKTGAPLIRIADLGSVWATFDAYENQLGDLREGQTLEVTVPAYPERTFPARIAFIAPTLDAASRTVGIRADLDNTEGLLKPGMFITGTIGAQETSGKMALSIPESAVLWTGERSVVYVKTESELPVFEMREIQIGHLANGRYPVMKGLQEGDEIVAKGAYTVDAAAQLQGKPSMMGAGMGHMPSMGKHTPPKGNPSTDAMAGHMGISPALLEQYMSVKEALVQGRATEVKKGGEAFLALVQKEEGRAAQGAEKERWTALVLAATQFSKADRIAAQQDAFAGLSDALIAIVKKTPNRHKTLYVQQCPMADHDQSARWLSFEPTIQNPYFAGKMMACGSVIDSLPGSGS